MPCSIRGCGTNDWVSRGPRPLAGPPTRKLARRGQSPGLALPEVHTARGRSKRNDKPMPALAFAQPLASPESEALRAEVRAFVATELAHRGSVERAQSWSGFDPAFSRKMAQQGWIGMTFP